MRANKRFQKAEREVEQGRLEQALTTLYAEWARPVPKDEERLAEFQRLVTLIQERASGEISDKAEPFLENINRHIRGEVPAQAEPAGATTPARRSEAHRWVGPCVLVLTIASVLSALGGLLAAVDHGLLGFIVGLVAAAVWLGAAVGLQLLSEAAQDVRRLTEQFAGED